MDFNKDYSLGYIKNKMSDIKQNSKKIMTNVFSAFSGKEKIIIVYEDDYSIFFVVDDNSVNRGYFYSSNDGSLKLLLNRCEVECIVEIITKKDKLIYDGIFCDSGFKVYSIFRRYANNNLKERLYDNIPFYLSKIDNIYGENALKNDINELYNKLHEIFDPNTSHLPTKNDLSKMIFENQILIERENDKIISFLIYRIEGLKFYVNQVYNEGKKEIIHCILMKAIKNNIEKGINYAYAWIDEKNERSIKFHERYGMEFDGLFSIAYKKQGDIL